MKLFGEHELKILESQDRTDLEKKLFEYVIFLIGLTNTYSRTLQYIRTSIYDIFKWEIKTLDSFNAMEEYEKMLEDLNKEFEWNFENHKPEKKE